MTRNRHLLAGAAIAIAASAPLAAPALAEDAGRKGPPPLATWSYEPIYRDGWSADKLFEETVVRGRDGEEIGDVENLVVGADGRVLSLIAEVGGLWDIGDTHVSVPWSEVRLADDLSSVTLPIEEDNVDDYSVFEDEFLTAPDARSAVQEVAEEIDTGPRAWRAGELIDDLVMLGDEAMGYVDDLVFDRSGRLLSVVFEGRPVGGPTASYAYPWTGYGQGWRPEHTYFTLLHDPAEVKALKPFDGDALAMGGDGGDEAEAASKPEAGSKG